MLSFIQKYYDIRSGEGKRAGLMFAYIFSIIAFILIVKPVSTSLFLNRIGITYLPAVYILVAAISGIVVAVYNKLNRLVNLSTLIILTLLFSIVSILFFWVLLHIHFQSPWFFYLFYVWVAIFSLITAAQFWLLANQVFTVREAKRLFGFLGIGAILGGIFGGYLTNILAPRIHSENLLLLGVLFLVVDIFLVRTVVLKAVHIDFKIKSRTSRSLKKAETSSNPVKLVAGSALLSSIMLLIVMSVFTASLVDYQFSAFASAYISDPNRLAAFFGFWLSTLSVVSLGIQVFLTQKIIRIFGVLPSLVTLPLGILAGAVGVLFAPGIATAVLLKLASGSLKNSIDKSGLELLVVPVPSSLKNRTKTFIDVFADTFATGLGGVVLIFLIYQLNFPVRNISYLIIILVIIQLLIIALKVRKEYIHSFRQAIEKRSVNFKMDLNEIQDAKLLESLLQELPQYNEKQILFILPLLKGIKNPRSFLPLKDLITHQSPAIRVGALTLLSTFQQEDLSSEISTLIHDENQEVRIEAMRYICRRSTERMETLRNFLLDSDLKTKSAALLCLADELKENDDMDASYDLLKAFQGLQTIIKHSKKGSQSLKIILAKVVAVSRLPQLYNYIELLLSDTALPVQEEAIRSAGIIRHKPFIPTLISKLTSRAMRGEARNSLVNYGEEIIPDLEAVLKDGTTDKNIRIGLCKTLGKIESQQSVNVLVSLFLDETFPYPSEVISALTSLGNRFRGIRFPKSEILTYVFREIEYYNQLKQIVHEKPISTNETVDPEKNNDSFQPALELFVKAVREKGEQSLEKIFRTLGLLYGTKDMHQAFAGLKSKNPSVSAHSIEFLDTVLSMKLKTDLIPVAEEYSLVSRKEESESVGASQPLSPDADSLQLVLNGNDNWLRVCALFMLGVLRPKESLQTIKKFTQHPDSITRHTAAQIMERIICSVS